ncbi:alpha-1A adrenergic receptor-like [Pangasianodon hypophthalmus]|uniref:alpha-1A adrenergic receptor-like n=1 Tax=Pangasianodon hypophthalmus TaxID=310915 RepID=UPI0023072B0A|nr:alpha-1A adrenergic receptor-like [Pangasianodon hypophthalmus]
MDTANLIKSIIRGIMCLAGIIGNNWLCISSLPKSISQLRTNDALFVNLAVSNLITNYMVDILSIFHTEQYLPPGKVYCGIRFFLPEFSETSSILTTMFITMYWHQKLVGSLKRGGAPVQMDNIRLIIALLIGSWTFALVLNMPHLFFVAEDSENTTSAECKEELPSPEAEQAYEVVYITLANVIPLTGILYASIQITITLLQNEKRMKKMSAAVRNGGNTSAEKSGDNTNNVSTVTKSKSQAKSGSLVRAAKSVVTVAIFFLFCWVFHLIVSILDSVSPSNVLMDLESFVGASYTCIIPYIYLYGVQKMTCSRC